jgi:hypothetical protein
MPLQIGSPFTGLFRMLLCIMHAGEEQSEPFAGGGSSNSAAASAAPDNTAVIAAITQMDQIAAGNAQVAAMFNMFKQMLPWFTTGQPLIEPQPAIQPSQPIPLASDVSVVKQFVDQSVKDVKHLQRSAASTKAAGVRYTQLKSDILEDTAKPLPNGLPNSLALPDLQLNVSDKLPSAFCDKYNSEIKTALRACAKVIITQLALCKTEAGAELQNLLDSADTQFATDLEDVLPADLDPVTRARLLASATLDYQSQRDTHLSELKIQLANKARKQLKNEENKREAQLKLLTSRDSSTVGNAIDSKLQDFGAKLKAMNSGAINVPDPNTLGSDIAAQVTANADMQKTLSGGLNQSRKNKRGAGGDDPSAAVVGKKAKKKRAAAAARKKQPQSSNQKSPRSKNVQGAPGSSPQVAATKQANSQKRKRPQSPGSGKRKAKGSNKPGSKKSKHGAGRGASN